MTSRWLRKLGNDLTTTDALGVNNALARGGFTFQTMRKMSRRSLVAYIDTLVIQPDHEADVDFYLRELLRREQCRTNTILIGLATVAMLVAIVSVVIAIVK